MLVGLDHVARAVAILATGRGTDAERLGQAFGEFRIALAQPHEWPADLLHLAEELKHDFLCAEFGGVLEIDKRAGQLADRLLMLGTLVHEAACAQARRRFDLPNRVPAVTAPRKRALKMAPAPRAVSPLGEIA